MSAPRSRAAIAGAAVLGIGFALLGPAAPAQSETRSAASHAPAKDLAKGGKDHAKNHGKGKPGKGKPGKPGHGGGNGGVVDADSRQLQRAVTPQRILKHLREFQAAADRYGDRAAGREGYNAGSRYVEAQLRDAGYKPRRQYFDFTYTEVRSNTFTVGGTEIANEVFTNSPSTPSGGVTAELVTPVDPLGCDAAAWSGVDATGKIALVNRGTCTFAEKSTAAKAAGAAAVVIWNNVPGPLTAGTLGEVTPDLAPATGISQEDGQALVAQVAQGPVEATLDLDILVEQRRTWNVIAETKRGDDSNVVMQGAHLDGVPDGPGINDNGSGSATLLETAIQLKKQEKKLRNQVRFAWWGAEEIGLLGSQHYVDDLLATDPAALDDIAVYLNYDMLGSPNYIIGVYDADESTEEASAPVPAGSIETERAYRAYFDAIGQPVVDTAFSGRSDYQAFIENGVAAGGLFSGADDVKTPEQVALFGGTAGIIHDPNYHTPADDLDNVDPEALDIMSDAVAHMTITLGKSTRAIDTPSGTSAADAAAGARAAHRPTLPHGVHVR